MMIILLVAVLLDSIIGDPDFVWRKIKHPVTWMSNLLMIGERCLNNRDHEALILKISGLIWIITCCFICFIVANTIQNLTFTADASGLLLAIIISIFLAYRSLLDHVKSVNKSILTSNSVRMRAELSKIVGRETKYLDEKSITRATIETLAENFSDGFVAPVFWFLIAGLPGIVVYKMINTADSMIGNKTERFIYFGWASAKIDDAANYIPARITAIIFSLAALVIMKKNGIKGLKVAFRDSGLHASPNAGWPEASMAGILGVKLGGPRIYPNGNIKDTAWLGDGEEILAHHLDQAIKIVNSSWAMLVSFVLAGALYEAV